MRRRVKLYCPDVLVHTTTIEGIERAIIFGKKPYLTCEHTCVQHVFACVCVCISRHVCVFSFGSVAAPDLLLLEDDYGPREFPGR